MPIDIFYNLVTGSCMILATFLFHAYSLDLLIRVIEKILPRAQSHRSGNHHVGKVLTLFSMGVGIILIHTIEIWAWAILYLTLPIPELHTLESALYFSAVSFSTIGYGDVVLLPEHRLLGAMQGASGLILFGWSTALMFEILSVIYEKMMVRKRARGEPGSTAEN